MRIEVKPKYLYIFIFKDKQKRKIKKFKNGFHKKKVFEKVILENTFVLENLWILIKPEYSRTLKNLEPLYMQNPES